MFDNIDMINNCDHPQCNTCFTTQYKNSIAAMKSFKYDYNFYSLPTSIILCLTNNCNLQCPYCFVSQNQQNMSLEIAQKSIEQIQSNYIIKNRIYHNSYDMKIHFFGGEPLLRFHDIIYPILQSYSNIRDLSFTITTNGTLLTPEIIDFLAKHQITILLSFDGIEEVQTIQRPGITINSYEKVINILPYLLTKFPNTPMRATVTNFSIPYLYDTVIMAQCLGFKKIIFEPNAFELDFNKKELEYQFKKIFTYIQNNLHNNIMPIKVSTIIDYTKKIHQLFTSRLDFDNSMLQCGLGTYSCAITPSGDIIPCQEKASTQHIVLGNVFTWINPIIHEQFLNNTFKHFNTIYCDKKCDYITQRICLSKLCNSRLEDFNYTISNPECVFKQIATKTALQSYSFYLNNNHNKLVQNYFQ